MAQLSLWIFVLSLTGFVVKSNGSEVSEVIRVPEGSDVILPCSIKESVVQQLFDWRKHGEKLREVFMYNAGHHYNNGLPGQDDQFKGRVSYFPEQMKFGNASIRIMNTKITDTGNYTCGFPHLNGGETFNMKLVVDPVFKDRSCEISGAVPKPTIMIVDVTDSGVQLKCEVQGAPPKPELQWKDSDGNILSAETPEISERDGRYHITLQTTVTSTSTNCFQCVVQQKELGHETAFNITVPEKLFVESCSKSSYEWFLPGIAVGFVVGGLLVALAQPVACKIIYWIRRRRVRRTKRNKEEDPETMDKEDEPGPMSALNSNGTV